MKLVFTAEFHLKEKTFAWKNAFEMGITKKGAISLSTLLIQLLVFLSDGMEFTFWLSNFLLSTFFVQNELNFVTNLKLQRHLF